MRKFMKKKNLTGKGKYIGKGEEQSRKTLWRMKVKDKGAQTRHNHNK